MGISVATLAPELEGRLRKLVALTMDLKLDQVLHVRRATHSDPETLKLIPPQQLDIVFQQIIATKIQNLSSDTLQDAIRSEGASLLAPTGSGSDDYPQAFHTEDREILKAIIIQLAGTEEPPLSQPETIAPPEDFEHVFDDAMCNYVASLFKFFEVPKDKRGSATLPFALSSDFVAGFQSVLRKHVLPSMRNSRMVMAMSSSHNWAEGGAEKVAEILQAGEKNNPILYAWDDRWANAQLPKPPVEEKKTKGLMGKLKGKKKPPITPAQTKAQKKAEKTTKAIWKSLKDDAAEHGYFKATERDLIVFQTLLRYDMGQIETAWNELVALYNQEFEPREHQEPGREGSFRDGFNKWHNRLETHIGEFLVIKFFFYFAKSDLDFLKKYTLTHGMSEDERERKIPYLMEFLSQFK